MSFFSKFECLLCYINLYPPDWDQVMNAYERRPALDGTKLTIERVSASKQVLISNIAESVSKDHLELLIEKHVGNGSIADIDFEKGRSFAIVQFHQAEGKTSLDISVLKFFL